MVPKKYVRLEDSGDSFERYWSKRIVALIPEYEEFWNAHIIPLSFRNAPEPVRSKFIRPTQDGMYVDFADASYAAFYHLAFCHYWLDKLKSYATKEDFDTASALWGSETLYCYFSHAVSAYDSALSFCRAINAVYQRFTSRLVFDVEEDHRKPALIHGFMGGKRFDALSKHIAQIRAYRNIVVHERVVFLQNGYLPHPDRLPRREARDTLWTRVGLAAIGVVARDYEEWRDSWRFGEEMVPAVGLVEAQTKRLCTGFGPIWRRAKQSLDYLESTERDFRERGKIAAPDLDLTPARFEQARKLGRSRGTEKP